MVAPTLTPSAQLTSTRSVMSAEEFDAWVENRTDDNIYELIAGEVVEVPHHAYASLIGSDILTLINVYAKAHKIGWVTGEGGGFRVNGERYAPDVAFVRKDKQRRPNRSGYNPVAPDIAVEVISSNTIKEQNDLRLKLANYMLAGTIVLVVNSINEQTELHVPGHAPITGDHTSKITFGDALPGFGLDMKDVFDYANDIEAEGE